ncbi:hypothetical protein BVC71_08310 [Marivivens niveibacter]|uniref:Uncharacterized protein n=1 Tax=Marivivens niveibacter TaxID=1930667 RepID=A0A251X0B6_9RHOB|nr:hypothetical protein [Marivivens niveibacter]OUD09818.1 hypothetical protein BVC71_08310 [Marivivens niveibacter]
MDNELLALIRERMDLYHEVIWPLPLVFTALGLIALIASLLDMYRISYYIAATSWLMVGIVFFGLFFGSYHYMAYVNLLIFTAQAIIMAISKPEYSGNTARRISGSLMMVFGLVGYVILGLEQGRQINELAYFGTNPFPTIMFSLGLSLVVPARFVWVIPLALALFYGALSFRIYMPFGRPLAYASLAVVILMMIDLFAPKKHTPD